MNKFIFICFALLWLTACAVPDNDGNLQTDLEETRQEDSMSEIRHDTDKLKEWFPKLEGIVSAEWEVYEEINDTFSDLPAPTPLTAKGYIVLDGGMARKYLDAYQWNSATPDVHMKYVSEDKLHSGKWLSSWQFDHDFRPGTWIGYFWFDGESVLFDVGK